MSFFNDGDRDVVRSLDAVGSQAGITVLGVFAYFNSLIEKSFLKIFGIVAGDGYRLRLDLQAGSTDQFQLAVAVFQQVSRRLGKRGERQV